jgi:hypothetical protein
MWRARNALSLGAGAEPGPIPKRPEGEGDQRPARQEQLNSRVWPERTQRSGYSDYPIHTR